MFAGGIIGILRRLDLSILEIQRFRRYFSSISSVRSFIVGFPVSSYQKAVAKPSTYYFLNLGKELITNNFNLFEREII